MNRSRFSCLVCCFGDYPQYSKRALSTITPARSTFDIPVHVGTNACGRETIRYLRGLVDEGAIDTLIESRENLNKDQTMRLLLDRADTEYVLWFDDDSYVGEGWAEALTAFIESHHPFDAAGFVALAVRPPSFERFIQMRSWYVSENRFDAERKEVCRFPIGGLYLARTAFLRRHNYPDKAMVKKHGDMILGDLIAQQQGKLIPFTEPVAATLFADRGERRGAGEDMSDYRDVDPVTGESLESLKRGVSLLDELGSLMRAAAELSRKGLHAEALQHYYQALERSPNDAPLHYQIGNELREEKRYEEALEHYRRALSLDREYGPARLNLGNTLYDLKLVDEARVMYEEALEKTPNDWRLLVNIGRCFEEQHSIEEAVAHFRRAVAVAPSSALCQSHLARALRASGAPHEALLHYRMAVHFDPLSEQAHHGLGELWMELGEVELGLESLRVRKAAVKVPSGAEWSGEPVKGKKVLVTAPFRYDEVLLFARYLPILVRSGARVSVLCAERLKGVLKLIPGVEVLGGSEAMPNCDFHIDLLGIASVLKTSTHADELPYLEAPVEPSGEEEAVLLALDDAFDRTLVMELAGVDLASCRIHLLDSWASSARPDGATVHVAGESLYDRALVLGQMSAVVTSDHLTACIAASMGVETVFCSHTAAPWHFSGGERSSWYPNMRFVSQSGTPRSSRNGTLGDLRNRRI